MSEKEVKKGKKNVIFEDGAHYTDLNQGAIGNCYLISALAILGDK